jgi:hypothetical protein
VTAEVDMTAEADPVRGRRLTSWPSLITSRKPDDLDAFCDAVLRALDLRTSAEHTAQR